LSNNSLKAMKIMTPMIAAKNMAGRETVMGAARSFCEQSDVALLGEAVQKLS